MNELDNLLAQVEPLRDQIVSFHQDIVRIPTVNTGVMPTGNETPCAEYLQQRLAAEGIESEILESAPGRGNLIARLKGEGSGPTLMFMTHLDVVPIEDESHLEVPAVLGHPGRWPDLGARQRRLQGRHDRRVLRGDDPEEVRPDPQGRPDLHRNRRRGERRLLRLQVARREPPREDQGRRRDQRGWLRPDAQPRGPDLRSADRREGPGRGRPSPSPAGAGTPRARGQPTTRWRRPDGCSPRWRHIEPEIDLSHPIFDHLGDMVEGLDRPTPGDAGGVHRRRLQEELRQWESCCAVSSRMTLTPTILHAGVKSNSIPASATITCDVRSLPGQDAAYVKRQVEQTVAGIDGVTVDVDIWATSSTSPFGTPFTDVLEQSLAIASDRPDLRLIPSFTAGFTDSQYVRPLGVHAYGYNPIHPEGDTARAGVHGVNETIEVEALVVRTKAYLAAAYLTLVADQ